MLKEAIERSDILAVQNELKTVADINESIYLGRTPLMLAATSASPETVRLLVDRGANVNARSTFFPLRYTALMLAAEHARVENIAVLLVHGAEVNATDHIGRTPLMHLAQAERCFVPRALESAEILIQRGANVDTRDNSGNTAWALALFTDLPATSIPFPRNSKGDIARHRACKKALAKLILKNAVSVSDGPPLLIRMGGDRSGASYHGVVVDPLPTGATTVTRSFSGDGYRGNPITMNFNAARGHVYIVDYEFDLDEKRWSGNILKVWPE